MPLVLLILGREGYWVIQLINRSKWFRVASWKEKNRSWRSRKQREIFHKQTTGSEKPPPEKGKPFVLYEGGNDLIPKYMCQLIAIYKAR